jgi:transcription termination/antitermination protein NusG
LLENWFAVYVQARHEKVVAAALLGKGVETCLPLSRTLRTWSDRRAVVEEPVFPCYVFSKFDPAVRVPILRTSGVVRIVGAGSELVPVEAGEIDALQLLERTKVPVEQWPFLEKGDRVCIEDGPLKGLSGIVSECKKGLRVVISVSLLQRSVAVEVSRCHLRSMRPAASTVALSMAARAGAIGDGQRFIV